MSAETAVVASTKRARSEEDVDDESAKKRRVSTEDAKTEQAPDHAVVMREDEDGKTGLPAEEEKKKPRKAGRMDEKQRSRRLFGSLLGTLVKPVDRTVKKRQEIEDRRKAELRKQDEDIRAVRRPTDTTPQSIQKRREEQLKVDEDSMRTRHRSMRHSANFLKSKALPPLYYRPWELRADERETIEKQRQRVDDQIDDDLDEFESRRASLPVAPLPEASAGRASPEGRDVERPVQAKPPDHDKESTDGGAEDPMREYKAADSNQDAPKAEDAAMKDAFPLLDVAKESTAEPQFTIGAEKLSADAEDQDNSKMPDDLPANHEENDPMLDDIPVNHQEEDTVLY